MKGLLLRGGLLVATLLAASVAYYLAAGLAIALAIAVAVAMLAVAFVATPVSLVSGTNSRQSFLVPILMASSMALGAIGAALSDSPFMVVAFVLGMLAMTVLLARSASVNSQPL
jgi:hypothetical protein